MTRTSTPVRPASPPPHKLPAGKPHQAPSVSAEHPGSDALAQDLNRLEVAERAERDLQREDELRRLQEIARFD